MNIQKIKDYSYDCFIGSIDEILAIGNQKIDVRSISDFTLKNSYSFDDIDVFLMYVQKKNDDFYILSNRMKGGYFCKWNQKENQFKWSIEFFPVTGVFNDKFLWNKDKVWINTRYYYTTNNTRPIIISFDNNQINDKISSQKQKLLINLREEILFDEIKTYIIDSGNNINEDIIINTEIKNIYYWNNRLYFLELKGEGGAYIFSLPEDLKADDLKLEITLSTSSEPPAYEMKGYSNYVVLTNCSDPSIYEVWDLNRNKQIQIINIDEETIGATNVFIIFTKLLIIGTWKSYIQIINIETSDILLTFKIPDADYTVQDMFIAQNSLFFTFNNDLLISSIDIGKYIS